MATREVTILLGVEKKLLLRARRIAGVVIPNQLPSEWQRAIVADALREWLVAHTECLGIKFRANGGGVLIWDACGDLDITGPHYLTALCKAAVKLEDEG